MELVGFEHIIILLKLLNVIAGTVGSNTSAFRHRTEIVNFNNQRPELSEIRNNRHGTLMHRSNLLLQLKHTRHIRLRKSHRDIIPNLFSSRKISNNVANLHIHKVE